MYLIDNCIILNMRVMHSYAHYDDYVYICILWNLLKRRMSYVTVCINDLCDTESTLTALFVTRFILSENKVYAYVHCHQNNEGGRNIQESAGK